MTDAKAGDNQTNAGGKPDSPAHRAHQNPIYCPPYTPVVGVLPEGETENFSVTHIEITQDEIDLAQLRDRINNRESESFDLEAGFYAKLFNKRDHQVEMTDTPMERRTCMPLIEDAFGDILIGGLGVGMVVVPLLANDAVTSITVVEREAEVVSLVAPHLQKLPGGQKLRVVNADVTAWTPPEDACYDRIWMDIWPNITADNLDEMLALEKRYSPFLKAASTQNTVLSWRLEDVKRLDAEPGVSVPPDVYDIVQFLYGMDEDEMREFEEDRQRHADLMEDPAWKDLQAEAQRRNRELRERHASK